MTVYLYAGDPKGNRPGAPADSCTVDLTPRRCQRFKARPGERFSWTNTSLADGQLVQSGVATADKLALVTLEKVTVGKAATRLSLRAQ